MMQRVVVVALLVFASAIGLPTPASAQQTVTFQIGAFLPKGEGGRVEGDVLTFNAMDYLGNVVSTDYYRYTWEVSSTNGQIVPLGGSRTFQFTPRDNGTYTVKTAGDATSVVLEGVGKHDGDADDDKCDRATSSAKGKHDSPADSVAGARLLATDHSLRDWQAPA